MFVCVCKSTADKIKVNVGIIRIIAVIGVCAVSRSCRNSSLRYRHRIPCVQVQHQACKECRHFSDKRLADFIDDLLNETLLTLACLKVRVIGELLHTVEVVIDSPDNGCVARFQLILINTVQMIPGFRNCLVSI